MLIEINPHNPPPRKVRQVVEALQDDGVVAFPTDTIYGIGCDIFSKKALKRVEQIKRLPRGKTFSFICPGLEELSRYARVTNYAYKTMRRLLPGPYTFILEGSREVPKMMLTRQKTAGIRVPAHPIPRLFAEELGRPILSTSATGSNGEILNTAWEIDEALGHLLDLVVDGGPAPGVPSSVVSLVGDLPEIIREGAGPVEEFR